MASAQELQNQVILDYAKSNFSSETHEYGRGDMAGQIANKRTGERIDSSRNNEDGDRDGRKGVDCSSMVYYSLKGAGFNLNKTVGEFTTAGALFNGSHPTDYAKEHFDILPPSSKTDLSLKAGDLIMLKMPSGSQHVAIFKEYDDKGRIHFFGSQTSTGPAEVTLTGNSYWDKQSTYYGALRPKEDFIKPEFKKQGTSPEPDKYHNGSQLEPVSPQSALTPKDATHPNHELHSSIANLIKDHEAQKGITWGEHSEKLCAALTVEACKARMTKVDELVQVGPMFHILQDVEPPKIAKVDSRIATQTPEQNSFNQLAALNMTNDQQQSQQIVQQQQREQNRNHGGHSI